MKKLNFFFVLILVTSTAFGRRPPSFRIGSIFLEPDLVIHQSFAEIVKEINADEDYLNGTRMDYNIQYVLDDPYDAHQKICMEMSYRVVAVFGSSLTSVDRSLGSVCKALHIPYLTTSPAPVDRPKNDYVLHLGPTQMDLISAVAAIIDKLKWEEVALVSHRETGSLDTQILMEILQWKGVRVRLLDLKHADIRPGVVELRNQGIEKFLVDVGAKYLNLFFEQAMKSGIVHSGTTFLPVSLDLSTINMESVRHTGATVLGFSIVDRQLIDEKQAAGEITKELAFNLKTQYHAALLHDGAHLFARAVEMLFEETDLTNPQVSCDDKEASYPIGDSLLNKIDEVEHIGLTGRLSIKNGIRQNVKFSIIKLNVSGEFSSVGHWTMKVGDLENELVLNDLSVIEQPQALRQNKQILKVQTVTTDNIPYMMRLNAKDTSAPPTYEGFLVDLLDELSRDVGFQYVIEENSKYGHFDEESRNWTGMIGALVNKESDFALADLVLTPQRSQVVDFSPPFQTFTSTIVTRKFTSETEDFLGATMFGYLNPFSFQMWISILVAYFLTSLLIFVIGRLSPYERHRNGENLSLENSFWFVLAGFLQRSATSVQPKSLSTRFMSAFWWLFCTIILVLYIVSLGTGILHQINAKVDPDLNWFIKNDESKLITLQHGATAGLLKHAKDSMQQSIWYKIVETEKANNSHKFSTISEGIDALNSGEIKNLGFVMEGSYAEFLTAHNCDLTSVGHFGMRHYSIAFPKGSIHKDAISNQILSYIHDGTMESLKQKWIQKTSKCPSSTAPHTDSPIYNPTFYSILAPFLLLLIASIISLILALLELFYFSFKTARKNSRRGTVGAIIKSELVKACQCFGNKNRLNNDNNVYGSAMGGLNGNGINGSGYRYGRPSNGSDPKSGSSVKNGHNFYQAQALLRKDTGEDVNSQL